MTQAGGVAHFWTDCCCPDLELVWGVIQLPALQELEFTDPERFPHDHCVRDGLKTESI